jgi:hypothetical protein
MAQPHQGVSAFKPKLSRSIAKTVAVLAATLAAASANAETRLLPSWVKLAGEIRGRAEVYAGSERVPGATEWYYLNRVRFSTALVPTERLYFFFQLQDSRAARTEGIPAPPNLVNTADLRQAYIHYGAAENKGFFIRAGRQPLTFGGARLVWMSEWGNVGPGFDGVRVHYGSESYSLNWFGAAAVRNLTDSFDRPRWERQIHGFFGTFRQLVPKTVVEPFALWKHNRNVLCERGHPGHSDLLTVGARAGGRLHPRFDWTTDIAAQSGHVSSDKAHAWAAHVEAGVHPWDPESGPRLLLEYQRASGDDSFGDGERQSFDQLYPAWKFGTADPIGWSNMQEVAGGVEWKAWRIWEFRSAYHQFWLLSLQDNLYSPSGAVLARNPNATSRRIGGEVDFRVTRRFSRHFSLMAGIGRFMGGPYWRETRRTAGITFPFAMWNYSF